VIWGTGDTVLPCPKPSALPASFAFNVLPGLGHMLPEEAPDAVVRVLLGALGADA
jgi:pimeloyl-ACP methyl ester carboxylesterase